MAEARKKPNVNPTPKQEFMENSKFVSMHREMMQQPMMYVSIQYALLQYQREMANVRAIDGNAAATSFFKIQGALEFVDLLRKLGETPEIVKLQSTIPQLIQT
jgi:hypothetical protein